MTRLSDAFIDALKERVNLQEVVQARLSGLKRQGKNLSGCCPFHQEKTPSFIVNPQKQFYHCFGCGVHGDAIEFVMQHDQKTFMEAIEYLAELAQVPLPSTQNTESQDSRQPLYEALFQAQQYYIEQRKKAPAPVQAYLDKRGLTASVCEQFAIGYSSDEWQALSQQLKLPIAVLSDAGLVIQKSTHKQYDRFRGRLMFPIRDPRGRTVGFGARALSEDQQPKYLNSPETDVFHKQQCLYGLYEAQCSKARLTRYVLTEGYMDVVALAQAGVLGAMATLGTAISTRHFEQMFKRVSQVVLCFDSDAAGKRAALSAIETVLPLMDDGRTVFIMHLPEGHDPDSYVKQYGKSGFLAQMDVAQPLSTYLFQILEKQHPVESMESAATLAKTMQGYIHQLPQGYLKRLMQQQLERRIGISTQSRFSAPSMSAGSENYYCPPAVLAGRCLYHFPQLAQRVSSFSWLTQVSADGVNKLYALLRALNRKSLSEPSEAWQKYWRDVGEESSDLGALSAWGFEAVERAFLGALARLAETGKKQLIEKLIEKSKQGALSDDEKVHLQQLLKGLVAHKKKP